MNYTKDVVLRAKNILILILTIVPIGTTIMTYIAIKYFGLKELNPFSIFHLVSFFENYFNTFYSIFSVILIQLILIIFFSYLLDKLIDNLDKRFYKFYTILFIIIIIMLLLDYYNDIFSLMMIV